MGPKLGTIMAIHSIINFFGAEAKHQYFQLHVKLVPAGVVEWNRNLLYWSYAKKALLLEEVCLALFGVNVGAVELC